MKKLPAFPVFLIAQGSFAVFFTMMATVSALYRVQTAGLDPLQLVLVGTVLEATVFVFEIPTGIVADLYSRRLSVIIGYFLIGLGFMLEGAFPYFATILLAQVVWGIGATFTSGAESAWLADEVGDDSLAQIYLRGSQVGQIGAVIGILISVGLGSIALNLPIFISGIFIVALALFLVLFMPEIGFKRVTETERSTWQNMGQTFKNGTQVVRGRPVLIIMLAIAFVYGLSSEGWDRLWEAHLLTNFFFPSFVDVQPIVWFGAINIAQMFLIIGATEVIRRKLRVEDQRTALSALFVTTTFVIIGLILYGLVNNFAVAVVAILVVSVFRGLGNPLYAAWLNKGLDSNVRATVLSMRGQIDAIGQFVGGPIIGFVALRMGLRAAMIGVAMLLSPALVLYNRAIKFVRLQENSSIGQEEEIAEAKLPIP